MEQPDERTPATDEAAADRDPVAETDEERAADAAYEAGDPERRKDVAAHEKEMMELGANVEGEGKIE